MTHCINCGRVHKDRNFPKRCYGPGGCNHTMFNNPIPVVTILQPVITRDAIGLAIAQRADNEGWALFAGHVDPGENLEQAVVREFREETGIEYGVGCPAYYKSQFTPHQVMPCFSLPPIDLADWGDAVLCAENLAFDVLWEPNGRQLIFPLHRQLVLDFFGDLKG